MRKVSAYVSVGVIGVLLGAGGMWHFMRERESRYVGPGPIRGMGGTLRAGVPIAEPGTDPQSADADAPDGSALEAGSVRLGGRNERRDVEPARESVNPVALGQGTGVGISPGFLPTSLGGMPLRGSATGYEARSYRPGAKIPEEIEDAYMEALMLAQSREKEGFVIRESFWTGTVDSSIQVVPVQLFRGNEYWFFAGADRPSVRPLTHAYNPKGDLESLEILNKGSAAAVRVVPETTGTHFVALSFSQKESSPSRRAARWALVYSYR